MLTRHGQVLNDRLFEGYAADFQPFGQSFYREFEHLVELQMQKLKKWLELHRFVKLRQRYIFTKNDRVRLRYVAGVGAMMAAAVVFAMNDDAVRPGSGWTQYTYALISSGEETVELAEAESADYSGEADAVDWAIAENLQSRISSGIRKASVAIHKARQDSDTREVEVGRGETLASALQEAGVSGDDAYFAVKALSEHVDPRSIKAGQVLNVQFTPGETGEFKRLSMDVGPVKQVSVRKESGRFVTDLKEKELKTKTFAGYAEIQNSLYGSAERAGIPPQAVAELIRLYSRTIDFQRDIQKGDKIEVLYDGQETEDGAYTKYGSILYANLTVGGKDVSIYRFETKDGRVDYYDPQGRTTRKTLLKTPVDGARISSGFGMRRHPILGYSKMHKGMDFAAPTGTPIYAAGDGTVSFAGRKGGYGNFITIRHNSEMKTAYGHMSRFAKGVSAGKYVKQGEVIGYVGSTGRSTGPHLHYEVLVGNAQVNPRSIDLPTGENLKGKELERFRQTINGLRQQYVSLGGMKLAQAQGESRTGRALN
ncbi:MAG: peptidoglycan DD-metalloendopeptidase family protein [Alphaproteobacteria bacterium]|nr:peptidoglycan DD-metalloendopeptidase family protein [Alphaproteobacteria bacterium]